MLASRQKIRSGDNKILFQSIFVNSEQVEIISTYFSERISWDNIDSYLHAYMIKLEDFGEYTLLGPRS